MDGSLFDRITKSLSGSAARRGAVKAIAGVAVAARFGVEAAGAKKKHRCRKRGKTCGNGQGKCCNTSGLIRCQEFPAGECQELTGFRCCGLLGASCDPDFGTPQTDHSFGDCSCCAPLFCGPVGDEFRCREEDT